MSLTIGVAVFMNGLVCTTPEAAMEMIKTFEIPKQCHEVARLKVMPQAVVYRINNTRIVRMGTDTDPVKNLWVVTEQKVIGEPL